ncbi:MAG TPA: mechanosensitive ion channel family protein [Candidatus Acidoferrum sp.]
MNLFIQITQIAVYWGDTRSWLISAAILGGAILAAIVVHLVLFTVLEKILSRRGTDAQSILTRRAKKSTRIIFPLLALVLATPLAPIPPDLKSILQHALGLGVIASVGWAAIILTELAGNVILARHSIDLPDNLSARRIRTQTQVLQRIFSLTVSILTAAAMLMTFPSVRHLGVSLLASAGLAGLIVGMAARSTLSNLIAGIQVALTQPIRIEDSVVIEGEWGWIEEIDTTYVVVRIWDLRRLVVPLSYFIEKPFQNWTRTRADLLATAMIYLDYTAPVQEIREELHRILQTTELWDKRTWALQVTDATERTIQLRALMSARNSPDAFDLRCLVREKLVQFLQERYPLALPQRREQQLNVGKN